MGEKKAPDLIDWGLSEQDGKVSQWGFKAVSKTTTSWGCFPGIKSEATVPYS